MTKGFTLIEMMVVASITAILASVLVLNFSRSRTDLGQAAVFAGDAVREAQSMALSGGVVGDTLRCGYGIRFRSDGYDLYAGPPSQDGCSTSPTFGDAGVRIVRSASLGSQVLEVRAPLYDLFFEPPTPTAYANGDASFETARVQLCRIDTTDCRFITVYASGAISTSK